MSYFGNIRFFSEDIKPVEAKCECEGRQEELATGKFTLTGRSFYIRKIPLLFSKGSKHDFEHVVEMFPEIIKAGYIPNPHPVIVTRSGFFTAEIYFEIQTPNPDMRKSRKIKTFDKSDEFIITHSFSNHSNIFATSMDLIDKMFRISHSERLKLLRNALSNKKYYVRFYCPLCAREDKDLVSAMIM